MTGSVLCGICMALLFFNVNISGELKTAYYVLINVLFWTCLTSCVIPHISLGTELTDDYDSRTNVRAYATFLMGIGTMLATSGTLVVVKHYSSLFNDTDKAWLFTGITYGILMILAYQISCRALKGKEPPNPNLAEGKEKVKLNLGGVFRGYGKAFRNKPLLSLLTITLVTNFVVSLGSSLMVYVFTYVYEYDEVKSSSMYFIQAILVLAAVIVAAFLANRLGKKKAMILGQLIYAAAYVVILLLPVADGTMFLSIVLYAVGNSTYWTLVYSMTYDTTLIEQFNTGENPTGLYVSMIGLIMKIGNSLGMFVAGIGLDLTGFDSALPAQSEATLQGIRTLYGIAPAVILLIGAFAAVKYGLTKENYDKLHTAFENKTQDKPYDIEGIEHIL